MPLYFFPSLLLFLLVPNGLKCSQEKTRLNRFINAFQVLEYDANLVHHRAKRSIYTQKTSKYARDISIEAKTDDKHFNLRLIPDTSSVFSENIKIEGADGKDIDIDLSHIVSGFLADNPSDSKVYGHIVEGIFEGKIHTPNDTYYVEKASRYADDLKRINKNNSNIHSIIYSSKDVNHAHPDELGSGCGNEQIWQWMNEVSNSAVPEENRENSQENKKRSKRSDPFHLHSWTAESRVSQKQEYKSQTHYNTHSSPMSYKRRACALFIQTDTFLWEKIRPETDSDNKAREEIASLVAQHIKAVNHIYESANFQGIRGLKFIVQRLKINESTACNGTLRKGNPFCSPNIDVSNFLNLNSQMNHDDFCLAYIFTYRDFSGGTLGLAWVASTSGASGGICEKYKSYTENIQGRQVQTKRSLNTGIVTFVNYNSRVPPKVSELTLAHEIGHNFGSPHDFPSSCRPGGTAGNYIMYSSATSGERPNNNKFSECSIRNISAVLNDVFNHGGKANCFQEDDGAFCGNKIVEEGEQCDCGYDKNECTEKCCIPKDTTRGKPCHRISPNPKFCSPSEGPCCSESCSFEGAQKLCKNETECTYEVLCSGYNSTCPKPMPKPDKTECNGGTQVCVQGICGGSICQKYNMEECFLTIKGGSRPDEMCEVACQIPNDPKSCKRTSEIPMMKNISGLKLRPGSPCNDFQGYCDVFQKCRSVDAEGPLARLKNLLWNHKTLSTIKEWATTYWWACMLMVIALLLFMAAFIKCCAVHTPSSNPNKRPALKLTDTLRRPADALRRKRPRPSHSRSQNQAHGAIPLQPSAPTFADLNLSTSYPTALQMPQSQLVVALPPENHSYSVSDPPPPYPGLPPNLQSRSVPQVPGPSHGYGEGRGHYNRKGGSSIAKAPTMPKTHIQPPNNTRHRAHR